MWLLLLNYVVLRALLKIDVHPVSTLVNKSLYLYYYNRRRSKVRTMYPIQSVRDYVST